MTDDPKVLGPDDPWPRTDRVVLENPAPITPQDIKTLMTQTGQYLMDVGYIMRRVPDEPMDNDEHCSIIQAVNVVTEHLTTVRERMMNMILVLVMDFELPKDQTVLEDPKDPKSPKDPKDYNVIKGSSPLASEGGPVLSSKYSLLGADPHKPAVTAVSQGDENGP